MAIVAKCTFFIRYKQGGNSFSLFSKPDTLEKLIALQPQRTSPIDRFLQLYMALLGTGAECPFVRISNEAISGDSLPFDTVYQTISSLAVANTTPKVVQVKAAQEDFPDFANTSALVTLAASSTQKGRMFMRFIPDGVINFPIGLNPEQSWVKAFQAWAKNLVADQWCIRSLADQNTNKPAKVVNVTRANVNDPLLVTTQVTHGLQPGDTARLSRTDNKAINKLYTVKAAPSTTSLTLQNTEGNTTGVIATGGTIRKIALEYPTISTANLRKVTSRKSGRPFDVLVGRRSRTKH